MTNQDINKLDEAYASRIEQSDDEEADHISADGVLLEIVRRHGYHKTAEKFENLEKWYA